MERIPPLEPPYPPDVETTLSAMMPPGMEPLRLFRTLAHNPRVLEKIRSSNLLDRGSLDRKDREIVILRTTARCRAEYEWGVHVVAFARRFGITDEQIAGTVTAGASNPCWDPKERALIQLVDELHDTATLSEDLWNGLCRDFEPAQLVELIVLTGFYHTISFVIGALGVDLESGAERFPSAS
jgi:4-carboxymuconolactone decarboxylase